MSQQIEGLPAGVKIKAVSVYGFVLSESMTMQALVQFEIDNIYGSLLLYSLPVPEGFERDGEGPYGWFRERSGDNGYWLEPDGSVSGWSGGEPLLLPTKDQRRILLRRRDGSRPQK